MAIKAFNDPGKFSGLGQTKKTATMEKESSGVLVSPVAFSRQSRSQSRTKKPLDRKMGSRRA